MFGKPPVFTYYHLKLFCCCSGGAFFVRQFSSSFSCLVNCNIILPSEASFNSYVFLFVYCRQKNPPDSTKSNTPLQAAGYHLQRNNHKTNSQIQLSVTKSQPPPQDQGTSPREDAALKLLPDRLLIFPPSLYVSPPIPLKGQEP